MSCGQLALERAGIEYDNYYSCEIDPHVIKVTQNRYPDTIQLGDVNNLNRSNIPPDIDLLLAGSPCQGFSFAGKELNFEDPRSALYFNFLWLYSIIKPEYYMLENVVMRKDFKEIISGHLQTEPHMINSNHFVHQQRKRLYWTDIPVAPLPTLQTKLSSVTGTVYMNPASVVGRRLNEFGHRQDSLGTGVYCTQRLEVHHRNFVRCITTASKDCLVSKLPVGKYVDYTKDDFRKLTENEMAMMQSVPTDYFDGSGVSKTQVRKMLANGWTVDVIAHIFNGIK